MDESFLSKAKVIKAAEAFVCVSLATYESAEEAQFLKTVFIGRSGQLENTVFCILSPDGQRRLIRAGRSPLQMFSGPDQMAATMNRIAANYSGARQIKHTYPALATVRLALNVAACDQQPLVIVRSSSEDERQQCKSKLTKYAWSDFRGQFTFAESKSDTELVSLKGINKQSNIIVVDPDPYGQTGVVLSHLDSSATDDEISDALNLALLTHQERTSEAPVHITNGRRRGIFWKTQIPVTDPGRGGPAPNQRRRP